MENVLHLIKSGEQWERRDTGEQRRVEYRRFLQQTAKDVGVRTPYLSRLLRLKEKMKFNMRIYRAAMTQAEVEVAIGVRTTLPSRGWHCADKCVGMHSVDGGRGVAGPSVWPS